MNKNYFETVTDCKKCIEKLGIKRNLTPEERLEIQREFKALLSQYTEMSG